MKKLSILFAVLALGMAMLFTSCDLNSKMEVLTKDQITSNWVDGKWSGTMTVTTDDKDPVTKTLEHYDLTADFIKGLYSAKGSLDLGDVAGASVDCIVMANTARTQMYIKQTSEAKLLGVKSKTITEYTLAKD